MTDSEYFIRLNKISQLQGQILLVMENINALLEDCPLCYRETFHSYWNNIRKLEFEKVEMEKSLIEDGIRNKGN